MIWTCSLVNSAICGVGDFLQQVTVEIRDFSVLTNKQSPIHLQTEEFEAWSGPSERSVIAPTPIHIYPKPFVHPSHI